MPAEVAVQNGGAAISCDCSQKPAVSHSLAAGSHQSLGTQQSCTGLGKGDRPPQGGQQGVSTGAQSGDTTVRLRVPAGARIWVPSSLQSSSAVSLPGQATHPQHFGCQFASGANSANKKFLSRLWNRAGIAKIRSANVFKTTNTHLKLEPKIPSALPKHITGIRPLERVRVQQGSRTGVRRASSVPGCGTSPLPGHPCPHRAGHPYPTSLKGFTHLSRRRTEKHAACHSANCCSRDFNLTSRQCLISSPETFHP